MGQISVVPLLDVEQFQMRDAALTVPEYFQHVLCGESGKLQGDAVAAAQGTQAFEKLRNAEVQKFRPVVVGRGGRILRRGQFGIAGRGQTAVVNDGRGEAVHAPHAAENFFSAGVVGLFQFHGKVGDFRLESRQKRLVYEFGQMQQRRLSVAHEGEKGFGIQRGDGNAEVPREGRSMFFIPQLQRGHHVGPQPGGGQAALVHEGPHGV